METQHNQDVHAISMELTLDLLCFIKVDNNRETCLEGTIKNQENETQHDKCANLNLLDLNNVGFKANPFVAREQQQEQRNDRKTEDRDVVIVNSPAVEENEADVTELDSLAALIAGIESLSILGRKATPRPEENRNIADGKRKDVNVGLGQDFTSKVITANPDEVRTEE